jgi:hypothetical protein
MAAPLSSSADDPAPQPPEPPDDSACCGSGCDPCIWDWYQQERERYLAELKTWQARQAAHDDEAPLRPGAPPGAAA